MADRTPAPLAASENKERTMTDYLDPNDHPCVGECGRNTNGYFEDGTHGSGWYCGWCEAIPEA